MVWLFDARPVRVLSIRLSLTQSQKCDSVLSMTFGRPSALLQQTVGLDAPLTYDLDIIGKMPDTSKLASPPDVPSTVSLFACTMYGLVPSEADSTDEGQKTI